MSKEPKVELGISNGKLQLRSKAQKNGVEQKTLRQMSYSFFVRNRSKGLADGFRGHVGYFETLAVLARHH